MEKLTEKTKKIMEERFGRDRLIAVATTEDNIPYVRNVNALYEDGVFYVITYALSNKMRQLEKNPAVAIAGDWFTAHGTGSNLGYVLKPENQKLTERLKSAFAEWIDNGHADFEDENTCILRIELTSGILYSDGARYDIEFTK